MIGKANWFTVRKWGGWGLSPRTWQGWAYIAVIALPMILLQNIPISGEAKTWVMILWSGFFVFDFIDIMFHLKKDERETLHEALAERNAMWFMVTTLAIGIAAQATVGVVNHTFNVDPVIIIALLGAVVVKALTYFYLRDK
jgi:hypothetical protein